MNGYSFIFTVVLIVAVALAAGVLCWGLIRGVASLSRQSLRKHGHRG
jgi:hypothetical protein